MGRFGSRFGGGFEMDLGWVWPGFRAGLGQIWGEILVLNLGTILGTIMGMIVQTIVATTLGMIVGTVSRAHFGVGFGVAFWAAVLYQKP